VVAYTPPADESELVAVVDTCVVLDTISCHDIQNAVESGNSQIYLWRVKRALDGLRLAVYFNSTGAITRGVVKELVRVAAGVAPPEDDGLPTAYVQCWLYFVQEQLLPDWRMDALGCGADELKGNAADDALVAEAARLGKPLISNEGFTSAGAIDPRNRMRRRAAQRGVNVITPGKYLSDKSTSAELTENFLEAFHQLRPAYKVGEPDYENAQSVLKLMYEFFSTAIARGY
jgi:hypothetical protein